MNARLLRTTALILLATALVACGGDDDKRSSTTSAETAPTRPLRILVTNDDGYAATGIDVVTQALDALPDVELTIVAPATDKSGTGSQTTEGTLTASDEHTASGLDATAVNGFPSDSVTYGLDEVMTRPPDVVVSGINRGQNLGPITVLSGTVGAAKTAAARGIPALAASQGLGDDPQYEVGAELVVAWISAHRDALIAGTDTVGVVNLNIPTCTTGAVRGVKQVPLALGADLALVPADCASIITNVDDDIAAFLNGFASVTQLTPAGETVTTSTTFPPEKPST